MSILVPTIKEHYFKHGSTILYSKTDNWRLNAKNNFIKIKCYQNYYGLKYIIINVDLNKKKALGGKQGKIDFLKRCQEYLPT